MNKKLFIIASVFTGLFMLAGAGKAGAASLPGQAIDLNQIYDFQVDFTPNYPGANTAVTAKIISYTFDTDISSMVWTINGKIVAQGKGVKSIEFKTGNIGSSINLSVSVTTEKGTKIQKTIKFTIGEVDILWQASSYTPGFYKGKALPTSGSRIKLTVIPQGLGAGQNLIYEWRRNFKDVPSASGKGKSSYSFDFTDIYGQEVVRVKVWGANKEYSMEKTIVLKPELPEIVLYEEDPMKGTLYEKILPDQMNFSAQPEIAIRAEPFFFPKTDVSSLTYDWFMNQKPLVPLDSPNVIGLTAPQDETGRGGYSLIQLTVKNPRKIMQEITKILKINL